MKLLLSHLISVRGHLATNTLKCNNMLMIQFCWLNCKRRFAGGCGGRPSALLNDVWLLTMKSPVWQWTEVTVINPQWATSHPSNGQLWCHPACKVSTWQTLFSNCGSMLFSNIFFRNVSDLLLLSSWYLTDWNQGGGDRKKSCSLNGSFQRAQVEPSIATPTYRRYFS